MGNLSKIVEICRKNLALFLANTPKLERLERRKNMSRQEHKKTSLPESSSLLSEEMGVEGKQPPTGSDPLAYGKIHSMGIFPDQLVPLTVEATCMPGLPRQDISGMTARAAKNALVRIKGALAAASCRLPRKRTLLAISPSTLSLDAPYFDLPLALATMVADGQIRPAIPRVTALGELHLNGSVHLSLSKEEGEQLATSWTNENLSGQGETYILPWDYLQAWLLDFGKKKDGPCGILQRLDLSQIFIQAGLLEPQLLHPHTHLSKDQPYWPDALWEAFFVELFQKMPPLSLLTESLSLTPRQETPSSAHRKETPPFPPQKGPRLFLVRTLQEAFGVLETGGRSSISLAAAKQILLDKYPRQVEAALRPPSLSFSKGPESQADEASDGLSSGDRLAIQALKALKDQYVVLKSIELVAAGWHNLLIFGAPGSGKTLSAQLLPYLLTSGPYPSSPPFPLIAPCPSVTKTDLLGSQRTSSKTPSSQKPGLIAQADGGILLLDEMNEFSKSSLEIIKNSLDQQFSLEQQFSRTPSEDSKTFSRFLLLGTANPCECGNLGYAQQCTCSENVIRKRLTRISLALLERIDLCIFMPKVPARQLSDLSLTKEDKDYFIAEKEKIQNAYLRQLTRHKAWQTIFQGDGPGGSDKASLEHFLNQGAPGTFPFNGRVDAGFCHELFQVQEEAWSVLLAQAQDRNLSARVVSKHLALARTWADLEGREEVEASDIYQVMALMTTPFDLLGEEGKRKAAR